MTLHVRMAWRSLRRTRGVTIAMIVALSLGIAAWYAQHQIFAFLASKEPLAGRDVFHVALERGTAVAGARRPQIVVPLLPSLLLTARDARGTLAAATTRHTMTFGAPGLLEPEGAPPETVRVRYATPDLFALFEVPIVAGRPWAADAADDAVIEEQVADRLFGSAARALGRTLRIDGAAVQVVGVVGASHRGRYQLYERFVPTPVAVYLPLARARPADADFAHVVAGGETGIMTAWVELPTLAERLGFVAGATAYLARERAAGRAAAPFAVTLRSADEMRRMFAPGGTMNLWPLLTAMCLVACVVNLVRMLMVKFAGRGHELGLLRAFGARRRGIMGQLLLEALGIGVAAGACGLALGAAMMPLAIATIEATPAGLSGAPSVIDPGAALTTIAAAVSAALVGALYPAWLLSRGTPAAQLGRG